MSAIVQSPDRVDDAVVVSFVGGVPAVVGCGAIELPGPLIFSGLREDLVACWVRGLVKCEMAVLDLYERSLPAPTAYWLDVASSLRQFGLCWSAGLL